MANTNFKRSSFYLEVKSYEENFLQLRTITASKQTVQAVHSCNSWFIIHVRPASHSRILLCNIDFR